MALFSRKKKEEAKSATPKKVASSAKKSEKSATQTRTASIGGAPLLVRQPKVSEKTLRLGAENKYVFVVSLRATKPEIKKQIESLYNVHVENVRSIVTRKPNTFRGVSHAPEKSKKMIVTLKKGEKIDVTGNI
jgi:large subunit ribosomal protein L23